MLYINQQFFKLLIFIVVLTCSGALHARTISFSTDTIKNVRAQVSDTILVFAEKMPEFPGGLDSMFRFIERNLTYPVDAYQKGISGKVYVQFAVRKDGRIDHIKVLKGIGGGCDEEVVRLVKLFPEWIPGQQQGKCVSVYYTVPIIFKNVEPLSFVEQMPEFPGGLDSMMSYFYSHLKYPKIAIKWGISGRVILLFVIDQSGNVFNIKVLRGIGAGCDEEAIRIVKSFPRWKPGKMNGKSVPIYFTLPIFFSPDKHFDSKKKSYIDIKNILEGGDVLSKYFKAPEFPGGNDSLEKFINANLKYPKEVETYKIGGNVIISFIVDVEGKIIDPKVSQKVNTLIDAEALRLVGLFPKWNPALNDGIPIEQRYSLSLSFYVRNSEQLDSLKKESKEQPGDEPLTFVEEMPEFPGGIDAMMRFLWANIRYPEYATEHGIMGRVVLSYVVDKNGDIRNIKVIRGVGGGCDEEAIRVVKLMPPWKPGRQNGKIVPVYFTLPVIFQLKE